MVPKVSNIDKLSSSTIDLVRLIFFAPRGSIYCTFPHFFCQVCVEHDDGGVKHKEEELHFHRRSVLHESRSEIDEEDVEDY